MVPPEDNMGDEVPDWLTEGDLDSDDAMAWLEEIAAKYDPSFAGDAEATPEPAQAEPAPSVEPVSAGMPEETELPAWLKEEPEAPVMPAAAAAEVPTVMEEEALPDWLREEPEAPAPAAPVAAAPAVPSLEEELDLPAWLQEEPAAPAPVAQPEEDALAWLDARVEEQGVPSGAVVSEALTVDQPPAAAPVGLPLDTEAEALSSDELPDWLKEAGGAAEMAKAMAAPGAEPELEEMPELEAAEDDLAWLESALEAEEEAAADLEGLFAGIEPAPPVTPPPPLVAEVAEEEELPGWLTEPIEEQEPVAVPEAIAITEPVDVAAEEELPDWLKGFAEEVTEEAVEEAPPMPALAEPAPIEVVTGVLEPEAEAEAAPAPVVAEAPAPAEAAMPVEAAAPPPWELEVVEEAPAPAPVPVVEAAPPAVEIPAEIAADFHEQLRLARERLSAKAYDEALPYYENLIAAGQMLDQTQSDLSYILKTAPATPPVRRVLGDAYRAQGRLQEALEEYRAALDSL